MNKTPKFILLILLVIFVSGIIIFNRFSNKYSVDFSGNMNGKVVEIEIDRINDCKINTNIVEVAIVKIEPSINELKNEKIMDTVSNEIINFNKNNNGFSNGVLYVKDKNNTIEIKINLDSNNIIIDQSTDIFTTDEINRICSYIVSKSNLN